MVEENNDDPVRRPLPNGTLIDYLGAEAEVFLDDGSERLKAIYSAASKQIRGV